MIHTEFWCLIVRQMEHCSWFFWFIVGISESLKSVLFLLQFTAPCVWDQVIHCIPDSRCTEEPLWPNTTGKVLSPRNDVWSWARAFATTAEKKWSPCSPWMALVDTYCQVGAMPSVGMIATSKSRWELGGKHSCQNMCLILFLEMHQTHLLDLEYPSFQGK